jgi:plasmid maintenance system antidote protein VapI
MEAAIPVLQDRRDERPSPLVLAAHLTGLSLRQLAKDLGVSHSHLSRAIRGERVLTPALAARLLERLGSGR